jgi:hypothetical protein
MQEAEAEEIYKVHSAAEFRLRLKRIEFSLFLWIAVFCLPVSAYIIWGFRGKGDRQNTDSYDILEDAIYSNTRNMRRHNRFREGIRHGSWVPGALGRPAPTEYEQMAFEEREYQIGTGYLFGGSLQGLFGVRGYRRQDTYYRATAQVLVGPPIDSEVSFFLSYKGTSWTDWPEGTYFSFPRQLTEPIVGSTNVRSGCLTKVVLISSRYEWNTGDPTNPVESIYTFSRHSVEYDMAERGPNAVLTCASTFTLEVRDALEPLPLDLPGVSSIWIYFLCLGLLVLGLFGLLFFIWHCWSVRYVLIKKAIWDSGVQFRR